MEPLQIFNNSERQQFQVSVGDYLAFLEYRLHEGMIVLMHTDVPDQLAGKGIGSALASFALNYAHDNHLPIKVYCPFVLSYLKRHPEYDDWVVKAD